VGVYALRGVEGSRRPRPGGAGARVWVDGGVVGLRYTVARALGDRQIIGSAAAAAFEGRRLDSDAVGD
jgi:hypothetical protein